MRSRRGLCGPRASPSATSRVPTEGGWSSRSTDRRYVLSEADPCARWKPVRSQLVDPTPAGAPRGRRRRGLRAVEQVCPYGDQVRDGTTSTRCRSHLTRPLAHSLARSLTRSFNLTAWWARRNCFRCVDLTRPADTPSTCARSRRLPSLPLTRATRFVRPPGRSFRRMHHLSRARYQVCPEKWRGPGALVSEPPGAAVCGQDWEPALQPADLCGLRRRVWRRLGGPLGWNSSDCLDY